jgi:hypothetical protein
VLLALLLAGILAPGCSDNSGRLTPTSATTTGDGIGGPGSTSLFVQVTVNPGSIDRGRRGSVLVIVSNANGIPLPGRNVQLSTSVGRLDATAGTTDGGGLFSTTIFIPCEAVAGFAGVVTAIVEGVVSSGGEFTPVTAVADDPCA